MKRRYGTLLVLLFSNLCWAGAQSEMQSAGQLDGMPSSSFQGQQTNASSQGQQSNTSNSLANQQANQLATATAQQADAQVAPNVDANSVDDEIQYETAFKLSCLQKVANSNSYELADVPEKIIRVKHMKYESTYNTYAGYCTNQGHLTRREVVKVPIDNSPAVAVAAQQQTASAAE